MSNAQVRATDRLTAAVLALAVTVERREVENIDTANDNVWTRYELFEESVR